MKYDNVQLFVGGRWRPGASDEPVAVMNPATATVIGTVAHASKEDLDKALEAAKTGFETWSKMSAYERSRIMRSSAALLRSRGEEIARILTTDEGKPLSEARTEVNSGADLIEWFAEEARRTYGRVIPSRSIGIQQLAIKDPVGPAVGFTPWNFPISQIVRKLAPALAAGCSIVIKGPEDAPGAPAALFRCLEEAGVPPGVVGLVFGTPSDISEYLVPHPIVRKISFTGSVAVGKQLASLAGRHMKRVTMELGGHAPAIIFDDANVDSACRLLVAAKFRNAGQVCISPTRFLVHKKIYDRFVESFVAAANALRVGDGLEDGVNMGPLINERRLGAVEALIEDAVRHGAKVAAGGTRIGNQGYFHSPTVLTEVSSDMRAMNEEPFGPIALVKRFEEPDEALAEANRLPFGLGAYAWTSSMATANELSRRIQSGMLTINHLGLGLPETPYGGVRDSGYGSEGGSEAVEEYLTTRFLTHDTMLSKE
jgi:succinate-semialdehyde dehydrogenase/glutarate-semialdehyde dehydrogenase